MTLTDENAFGFLIELFDLEELEYASEPEEFAQRFVRFTELLLEAARATPLGDGARLLELGHAYYFEIGDGDHALDPIAWLRGVCAPLVKDGFTLVAAATHGGRWLDEASPLPAVEPIQGGYTCVRASLPSEPLKRALHAASACHGTDGEDGWGSGLFVDTEVVDALGKQLKNAPTPLSAGGATFFRMSLPRP